MIRIVAGDQPLSGEEQFGLRVLLSQSRLPRVEDPDLDVVRVRVSPADGGPGADVLTAWIAGDWGFTPGEGTVDIARRTLRLVTSLAGAVAEQRTGARDARGRVPASANALVSAGVERQPLIARAGIALRDSVRRAAGRRPAAAIASWPDGRQLAVAVTHDLDVVRWWPVFTGARLLELAGRRALRLIVRTAGGALREAFADPVGTGVADILHLERQYGIRSSWYVLAGPATLRSFIRGNVTYDVTQRPTRRLLERITAEGHEIGLHGSFETVQDPAFFAHQRGTLQRITGQEVTGVRQHFLSMHPAATQQEMEAAGFTYDASFGFHDRSGFRLGVADAVPVWLAAQQRALALTELPLIWMDRTLSKYRGIERADAWVADALELAELVRDVEGVWTGLWHPNLTTALGFPGGRETFGRLLRSLLALHPYVATQAEIVDWVRRRSAAVVRRASPDLRQLEWADGSSAGLMLSPLS